MNKQELLLKEIDIVQSEIARFDSNGLTIKTWCIGTWAALIAYGVQNEEPFIVGSAIITTTFYSFIEYAYRRFQVRFIDRSNKIEQLLEEGRIEEEYHYTVHRTADPGLGCRRETRLVFKMWHFTSFYMGLVTIGAICVIGCLGGIGSGRTKRSSEPVPRISVSGTVTNITVPFHDVSAPSGTGRSP